MDFGPFLEVGAGGAGSATVRNNGRISLQGPDSDVTVGGFEGSNSTGTLNIESGGQIEGLFYNIGGNVGNTGNVTVSGEGSKLLATGSAGPSSPFFGDAAFVTVGRNGTGTFRLEDGGDAEIRSGSDFTGFQAGRNDGSEGTIVVSGSGSTLNVDGNGSMPSFDSGSITIGRNAGSKGELRIEAGGEVTNQPNGMLAVGEQPGSQGKVTISGAGSTLEAGSDLLIGVTPQSDNIFDPSALDFSTGGSGTVTVESGGTLSAGSAENDGNDDVFIGSSGTLQIQSGGTLVGDVRNEGGTFSPGNSPGVAIIEGGLDHTGSIEFEIDGTVPGEFDQIDVTGDARFEGEFVLDFGDDITPDQGDQFKIVRAPEGVTVGDLDVSVSGLAESLDAGLEVSTTGITAKIEDSVSAG